MIYGEIENFTVAMVQLGQNIHRTETQNCLNRYSIHNTVHLFAKEDLISLLERAKKTTQSMSKG